MGVRENTIVGGSLLMMCVFLCGRAAAMEPDKSGLPRQSSPAAALPTFLDDDRLPDLQEAWHQRASEAKGAPSANGEAAMSAARAGMKRADQTNQEEGVVRQRAEELSRRFGAAGRPAAGVSERPNTTGAIPTAGGAEPQAAEPGDTGAADASATAELPAAASPENPPGTEAPMSVGVPPAPVRPPKSAADRPSPRRAKRARAEAGSASAPSNKAGADFFPNNIRSFGWNSQPQ